MYVRTPKGIMYLLSQDETTVYCYDDQTGKEETFLRTECSLIFDIKKQISFNPQ